MSAALAFGEAVAGAVVAVMYAGGHLLEAFARRRAAREMTALLERAPRSAVRYVTALLQEVAIEAVVAGDRLLVRQGEIAPVDGTVHGGVAILDGRRSSMGGVRP
jgi:cation transport ATPase